NADTDATGAGSERADRTAYARFSTARRELRAFAAGSAHGSAHRNDLRMGEAELRGPGSAEAEADVATAGVAGYGLGGVLRFRTVRFCGCSPASFRRLSCASD